MPRYLPWRREFQLGDVMLWIPGHFGSLWHLPRRYSCLLHRCIEAIMAHGGPLAETDTSRLCVSVLVFPVRGENTAEFTEIRTETIPPHTGFASFLNPSNTSCSLRGLCSPSEPLHILLNVWTTGTPVSLPVSLVDTFSSVDLGWFDNNTPFILSHIPITIQIPGIRAYLGRGGLECSHMFTCVFAVWYGGQKSFNNFRRFKPLTISVSYTGLISIHKTANS